MKTNSGGLLVRIPDPFDPSAPLRLRDMGLLDKNGKLRPTVLQSLSHVHAGLFFGELLDFYSQPEDLQRIMDAFQELAGRQDYQHMYLYLSLQYDALRKPLPDAIWWISGQSNAVAGFMQGFWSRLASLWSHRCMAGKEQEVAAL